VTSSSGGEVEARRFLHCCYCCDDAEATAGFLVAGLGLRVAMSTTGEPFDGDVLGLDGPVEAAVSFAYDHRGPRVSPAIEIQAWVDPPPAGRPYASPHHVGIQAVGVGVADLEVALEHATRMGAAVGGTPGTSEILGGRVAMVRDPGGVAVDFVETPDLTRPETRLSHLRVTCRDLDRSVSWYRRLGFHRLEESVAVASGARFGLDAEATVRYARLRLPDEPMALVLTEWVEPASFGDPYSVANHRGLYRVAIGVDDTRGATERLDAAGVTISRPPERLELPGTNVPDLWIAFLRDPDGLPVELVERPRSAFR
jgi:catechol 2,3-dioxygenase-like lactoylglutathione lyase family enzyme